MWPLVLFVSLLVGLMGVYYIGTRMAQRYRSVESTVSVDADVSARAVANVEVARAPVPIEPSEFPRIFRIERLCMLNFNLSLSVPAIPMDIRVSWDPIPESSRTLLLFDGLQRYVMQSKLFYCFYLVVNFIVHSIIMIYRKWETFYF